MDEPGEDAVENDEGERRGSFWKELSVLLGIALVLTLIIKAFVMQAFYIPSQSMESTLKVNDRVLVNKIVYHTRDIARGDIVVFDGADSWSPEAATTVPSNPVSGFIRGIGNIFGLMPGETDYIKRVIGLPGDKIKCCDRLGRITVNGVPLDEKSYLYFDPVTGEQDAASAVAFEVTVEPGRLWVMGDHRAVSADSRAHMKGPGGGAIPEDRVIGRAFVTVWPPDRVGTLPIPAIFKQPVLSAADHLTPTAPLALGLVGAVPITWMYRRRRG